MSEVRWMIRYGVDDSHLTECLPGLRDRRRDAKKEFDAFCPTYPFKIVELVRVEFDGPYSCARKVEVVCTKRMNTKTMGWE